MLPHIPEIGARDEPAYHVVVQETDLYALGHFLVQKVPHFPAGLVVPETEILQMDEAFGLPDIFQQQFPFAEAGSNDFEGVARIDFIPFPAA